MSVQFHPSFARCAWKVTLAMLLATVLAYLWQGFYEKLWWTPGYMLSLLIPFTIAPVFVWFAFVPSVLQFDETTFTIKFRHGSLQKLNWAALKYYGAGNNVLMIQFKCVNTFQIFPQAFPSDEWQMLKRFLNTKFPDRKASGYIGNRMFRWPWKK